MTMKRARLRILAGILCAVTCAIAVQSDEATFQAGIQKEVVDGDLAGAIKFYEAAAKSTNNAEQVVRALNRMVIVSSYLQWRAPCRRKRKPTMAVLGDSESMVR